MPDEALYRREGLTIGTLARILGTQEHLLRRVINRHLGYRNFNVFLNNHRVEEAKAALADPAQAEVPVITIAMDAGFQSLGPFNRAFKAVTGVTPTEYRLLACLGQNVGRTLTQEDILLRVWGNGYQDEAHLLRVNVARLRGKAIAVGGEKRGIIASASYEARKFGIYTPMPTVMARRLCPKLILLPGDFEKYELFSRLMFSYAYDFTPDVEIGSIDEGYFDLTGVRKPAVGIAETIRHAIRQALKLSVSEGIAANKLVSQIASKLKKPAAFSRGAGSAPTARCGSSRRAR